MKIAFSLFAMGLMLLGCGGTDSGGLSANEQRVVGNWAGSASITIVEDFDGDGVLDTLDGTMTISITIQENHAYTVTTSGNFPAVSLTGVVSRESGTWTATASSFATTPTNCQEADEPGGTMLLIACDTGDTMAINIQGDTWNINEIVDGVVVTFPLRKI